MGWPCRQRGCISGLRPFPVIPLTGRAPYGGLKPIRRRARPAVTVCLGPLQFPFAVVVLQMLPRRPGFTNSVDALCSHASYCSTRGLYRQRLGQHRPVVMLLKLEDVYGSVLVLVKA